MTDVMVGVVVSFAPAGALRWAGVSVPRLAPWATIFRPLPGLKTSDRKPHVFRVLFTIDGDNVRILRIRRAQRRPLTRRDINQANNPDDHGIEP